MRGLVTRAIEEKCISIIMAARCLHRHRYGYNISNRIKVESLAFYCRRRTAFESESNETASYIEKK